MKDGKPVPALKAGGHLDPENKGVHLGLITKKGILGDLPGLALPIVKVTLIMPFLLLGPTKLDQIKDKALMVRRWGINYSDNPEALGGGGARNGMWCD